MYLCGDVYVSDDLSAFSLKCSKCVEILPGWVEFVEHIGKCLMPDTNAEPYIDVPSDNKLDILDVIEPEIIKQEDDYVNCSLDVHIEDKDNDDLSVAFKYENPFETDLGKRSPEAASSGEEETIEDDNSLEDDLSVESSSSDESYTNEKKKTKIDGARFTPSFYRHNRSTSFFIELYQNHRCLWDEKSVNFKDEQAHKFAYKAMIKSIKKDFDIVLKENKIQSIISRLRQQYYTTQENIKKGLKSKIKPLVLEYFQLCSFLGEIDEKKEDEQNGFETGFKIRCQVFSSFSKEVVDALIDQYAKNSLLHDANHPDFASTAKRGAALNAIVGVLKKDHNIELKAERLSNLIRSLREWYYKRSESKQKGEKLTQEELHYLDRCNFFPPRAKKKQYVCHLCDIFTSSDKTLQVHMVDVHKIGEMPHKCEECNRFFRQRSSLILHNQRSHSDKKLECEYCHRKYSVVADLRLHVRTHTDEKPYVCELCGKAFRLATQLGYHMTAIHTKVRAFKCNLCPKDFLKAVHLRDHIKSHLNIRDKICETCGKGFTNCHSLIRHRQIHSAVKKFECKLCDAKFHQFVGLNSHMKRTHNIVKNKPKA